MIAVVAAAAIVAIVVPTDTVLQPLKLSEQEISNIVAFLDSQRSLLPLKFQRKYI